MRIFTNDGRQALKSHLFFVDDQNPIVLSVFINPYYKSYYNDYITYHYLFINSKARYINIYNSNVIYHYLKRDDYSEYEFEHYTYVRVDLSQNTNYRLRVRGNNYDSYATFFLEMNNRIDC